MTCSNSVINSFSSSDAICQYAVTACSYKWDLLDFFRLYYCEINQNVPAMIILSIIIIAFTSNTVSSTADKYLVPSLKILSTRLKLSEAFAGVTFLAFANGSGDIISGFVAGDKANDGIDIAIGGLFGACLFTTTVVFARCIQGGGDIKVDKDSFIRDCSFLLIVTAYFLILTLVGYFSVPTAAGFLVIYVFYIGIVFAQERRKTKGVTSPTNSILPKGTKVYTTKRANSYVEYGNQYSLLILNTDITKSLNISPSSDSDDSQRPIPSAPEIETSDADYQSIKSQTYKEEEDNPTTIKGKILKFYNMPLLFIRNLTIFPFEEWNKWRVITPPFLGTLFILWYLNLMTFMVTNWWLLIILFAVLASASAYLFLKGTEETLERFRGFFATWAFFLPCLWNILIVTCFLDFLALISTISGLSLSFLSLTLIAWGTSMTDFCVDYSIAKKGYGTMAVVGVFGGQLFNMLVGFGLSLTRQTINRGTIKIKFYTAGRNHVLTMILIGAQLFGLIVMLVVIHKGKYVVGRKMKIFLMTYYVIFLFSVTLVSFLMKSENI